MTKLDFKSSLYSIVLRCRCTDSQADVLAYAKSRFRKGFFERQSDEWRAEFEKACRELHLQNIELYNQIVNGKL